MIRFQPDTWADALTRFFDMAAPDANVYVEIAAPDLRFAALFLFSIIALVLWRRLSLSRAANLALFALVLASTVPWLLTTGNGRYYIPVLLCVGPLLVGFICLLPASRSFKLFLAGGILIAQSYVVFQSSPWNSWSWLPWKESAYFDAIPPTSQDISRNTTYVTISSISYSLIAPQFPVDSRWINIASTRMTPRDAGWIRRFLTNAIQSGPVILLVPVIPGHAIENGRPSPDVLKALEKLLAVEKLALDLERQCSLIPSRGIAAIQSKHFDAASPLKTGFWACHLRYPVDKQLAAGEEVNPQIEAVFARVEQLCPRYFRPDEAGSLRIPGGVVRQYGGSDTRVYVLDDGNVLYKFWRSLNPVRIGTVTDILGGAVQMNCNAIRGNDRAWHTGR